MTTLFQGLGIFVAVLMVVQARVSSDLSAIVLVVRSVCSSCYDCYWPAGQLSDRCHLHL